MAEKRQVYRPPIAMDLSGYSATGQRTEGLCLTGYDPVGPATCAPLGGSPPNVGGACNPTGLFPNIGGCSSGQTPQASCGTGSNPNT